MESRAEDASEAEAFRFLSDEALRAGGPGAVWTWAELRDRARGVARELVESGAVGRGARVLLVYPAGLEFVAAFLGCLYLGAVPVPVSPPRRREKPGRWAHISQDAGVSALLSAPGVISAMAGDPAPVPCIVSTAADPGRAWRPRPDDPAPRPLLPQDLAFLQYTSGSTGAPKGVMVTHGMLAANLEQIRKAFRFGPEDRIAGWLPPYHDMGLIGGILTPVHLGVPNAMMSPSAFLRDPIAYLELAGRLGATIIGGPNFAYEHCLRHATPEALARVDLSGLRFAFSGAETIRPDTLRRFQEVFAPCGFSPRRWVGCYGLAEATLCVSVTPPGEGPGEGMRPFAARPGESAAPAESGAPAEGMEIAIVDPATGARAPAGGTGEIWLRGPNIAPGYWGSPEAGAGMFDQLLDGGRGWLRTGDLGALQGGRLYVTGRLKELIVVRGRNHHPQDIEETAAAAHADLAPGRAAAFAMEDGDGAFGLVCELTRRACRDPRPGPVFAAIRAAL
ncbi:MAG: fatty acyl-AMP ligase, partial [Pikeienuella sp.]